MVKGTKRGMRRGKEKMIGRGRRGTETRIKRRERKMTRKREEE
jgi:hypothetical protein